MPKIALTRERVRRALPFLFFFLAMLVIHLGMQQSNDDLWFADIFGKLHQSLPEYLACRYREVSSRFVNEFLTVTLCYVFPLFVVLNLAVSCTFYFLLVSLCGDSVRCRWFFALGLPAIDFRLFASAGWGATCINYLWPSCALLGAAVLLRKLFARGGLRVPEAILLLVCVFLASDHEQTAAVTFALLILCIVLWCRKRRLHKLLAVAGAISILRIACFLFSPATQARAEMELHWFPEYPLLSLPQKLYLGLVRTEQLLLVRANPVFFVFAGLLLLLAFRKKRGILVRMVACVPLGGGILAYTAGIRPDFCPFFRMPEGEAPLGSPRAWIPVLLLFAVCGAVCYVLWKTLDSHAEALSIWFVLACGFGTQFMMFASPTLYASGTRTATCLYLSLLFCAGWLVAKHPDDVLPRAKAGRWLCFGALALLACSGIFFALFGSGDAGLYTQNIPEEFLERLKDCPFYRT